MKNSLETRLGIFVALSVIAAVIILETLGGVEYFQPGHRLFADFNNVQDLKEGNPVKMAGFEIGRIEKLSLNTTNNKVRVKMKLKRDVIVRTDSVATVKFTGLMGQNFVSLDFGSPGSKPVEDGTVLTTAEQPDFGAIMTELHEVAVGVQNFTKSFTGDTIDNLLGPLTDFLKANRAPLTLTIANLQSISTQIAQGKGSMGRLIYDDALYNSAYASVTNLQDAASEVKLAITDARGLIDQAKSGQGTVGKLLNDDALYTETTAMMKNLREVTEKINHGDGTVGKLINDQEFYKNAKLSLQKLDKATEGLEDQGPLSVLGIVVNKLF